MKLRTRLSRLITASAAVVGLAAAAVALAGSASAATTPPWEPDPNASLGSIVFYDAAGNVITGGSNLNHLFDYAMASTDSARTTTNAQAIFAFPDHTKPDTTTWHKDAATASTTYPNTNPGVATSISSSTKPVATATSADADLQALLGSTTLDTTSGYANLVQIQLHDSGPGLGNGFQSQPFWATDIMFDANAGTWQQVYPAVAQTTTTHLAVSPSGGATPGSTVTLTATVAPGAAAGSVQFKDGATNLGSPVAVSSGTASTTTTVLTNGSHALSATFAPTDTTAYQGSTSNIVNYVIANVPGAPTGVSAEAGHAAATVSWTAPADNGGSAITGYDIEYKPTASATFKHVQTGTGTTKQVTGLTNGVQYTFEVAAINAVGKSDYAAAASAVTPSADTSSLTIGKSVTLTYGKSTIVVGTLTDTTTHKPAASQSVFLYHRASATAAWVKGTSQRTGSTGKASFTLKPTARTLYQLRFAGSNALKSATSGTETVTVDQTASINLTPGSVAHGKTFAVWGGVTPSVAGRTVTLQRKVGTAFKTVTSAMTKKQRLPNGKTGIGYVFHTSQKTKGSYVYRVIVAATKTMGGATSKSVTEHVS